MGSFSVWFIQAIDLILFATVDRFMNARVKLGFGEACLGFLREGGIDCVAKGSEGWANAEGKISFQMAASTARRRVTHFLGVVIFAAALGFLLR